MSPQILKKTITSIKVSPDPASGSRLEVHYVWGDCRINTPCWIWWDSETHEFTDDTNLSFKDEATSKEIMELIRRKYADI